jgi:hypothetical protein
MNAGDIVVREDSERIASTLIEWDRRKGRMLLITSSLVR